MKLLQLIFLLFIFLPLVFFSQDGSKTFVHTIYYKSNVWELDKKQLKSIDSIFETHGNIEKIELFGFADTVGNLKANQIISEKRAGAINDYVISNFDNILVVTKAKGEKGDFKSSPLSNQRRVDIVFSIKKHKEKTVVIPPKIKEEPPLKVTKKMEIEINPEKEFFETFNNSDRMVIENLLFEPGKTEFLHNKIPNELYYLAQLMDSLQSIEIIIEGHVCCVDAKKLSENRAKEVYTFLRGQGIDKRRMKFEGFSNSQPRVPELTKEDQKLNRRVEIQITQR